MSLIDQRIFIEAPVDAIWSFISDPALIPKWNRTCKQISVLSTKAMGLHSRRRCLTDNGRSLVEEITVWLEHLGYEAVQIDGPYQSFRSRYRLQAIPEGTIVNWSVEYKLRGPMGGLRDAATTKRHHQELMADSLRQLRRIVDATGVKFDPQAHARYAMQSPPSPESRIARMPTQSAEDIIEAGGFKAIAISDDDIPEMPPVVQDASAELVASADSLADTSNFVPAYTAELDETSPGPTADKEDTKPRPPKGLREGIAARRKEAADRKETTSEMEAANASASTVPISLVAPPRAPEPETEAGEAVTPTPPPRNPLAPPDTLPERIPTGPMPAVQDNSPDVSSSSRETREVSIWDVFGMERPSERAQSELEAVIASIQPKNEPPIQEQDTEAGPQLQAMLQITHTETITPVRMLRKRRHLKAYVQVRPARK